MSKFACVSFAGWPMPGDDRMWCEGQRVRGGAGRVGKPLAVKPQGNPGGIGLWSRLTSPHLTSPHLTSSRVESRCRASLSRTIIPSRPAGIRGKWPPRSAAYCSRMAPVSRRIWRRWGEATELKVPVKLGMTATIRDRPGGFGRSSFQTIGGPASH